MPLIEMQLENRLKSSKGATPHTLPLLTGDHIKWSDVISCDNPYSLSAPFYHRCGILYRSCEPNPC